MFIHVFGIEATTRETHRLLESMADDTALRSLPARHFPRSRPPPIRSCFRDRCRQHAPGRTTVGIGVSTQESATVETHQMRRHRAESHASSRPSTTQRLRSSHRQWPSAKLLSKTPRAVAAAKPANPCGRPTPPEGQMNRAQTAPSALLDGARPIALAGRATSPVPSSANPRELRSPNLVTLDMTDTGRQGALNKGEHRADAMSP